MRTAFSLFAMLLLVAGCPGMANTGARGVTGGADEQNSGDATEPDGNTNDPTEPSDPTEPGGDAKDPTEPNDPADPGGDALDPTEPDDPTDPGATPADPTEPDDPNEPADPTDPDDPEDPEDPEDPDDPADPGGSGGGGGGGDLPDIPDDLPAGADYFLALYNGPAPDGVLEAFLASNDLDVVSFEVDSEGVYTIEVDTPTSEAGTVEAKGTAIGTTGITALPDPLPIVPEAANLTIDITALVDILDPNSPRFTLVVVYGGE